MSQGRLLLGDCLKIMPEIPSASVDMILCDLPYGTTACPWDSVIPLEPLWAEYRRLIKPNGAIVLTASQPFTTALISSNMDWFKYCWVWEKSRATGFMQAKNAPLRIVEDICIFSMAAIAPTAKRQMVYNPQGLTQVEIDRSYDGRAIYGGRRARAYKQERTGYPKNLLRVGVEAKTTHPTQKPVALFEYLIRTYTNPGDTVLDNCIGSGTTAIAAINTGRNWIGIERDPGYYQIASRRIEEARA